MALPTSPRADKVSTREYMKKYFAVPANRERHREAVRRYAGKPEARARRNARERAARKLLRERMVPESAECAMCGDAFERPMGPGRPRMYCLSCVSAYKRPGRQCPECGMLTPKLRSTCRSCGAIVGDGA